ncbi:hypothetical protein CXB51_010053 [Gossypium anomalum]|uniref:Zinc finger, CCHC-type n=1 Tax=Gossypium anomalum TaxID=47600 RepID=A0A8J5ZCT5_9ROSI|nr:hypothetical protein CXB51_010053 [Gossypium anomalum]
MAANTNSLSLRLVFEKDKLNGLNFFDWFRNLRIVLKQEQKLYVIEQPIPNKPPSNALRADRDFYKKHPDDMKQHKDMVAYDMIENLKELFLGQARQERFDTSKAIFQCKLVEGSPVGPHVLKMIGYIDSLSKLGFPLSQELATDVILQSLPDSYSQLEGVAKKGNCFHYGVTGHSKGNCPVYLEEVKKAKGLQMSRTLARGDMDLRVGNGARVAALAYFITFTDDFSRYGYVYLMRHKFEALEKFKESKNEVQNLLGKTIKTPRSDRGGEVLA